MDPLLVALDALGGAGSNDEIRLRVAVGLGLTAEEAAAPHGEKDKRAELEYRLAWVRVPAHRDHLDRSIVITRIGIVITGIGHRDHRDRPS